MANDSGTIKYWINGFPIGIEDANDNGTMKYFINGMPAPLVPPSSAPAGTAVKWQSMSQWSWPI